ncbi:MAG: GNAT family N-acetyltransferase [Nocardioidaceae bacterium]
MARIRPYAPPDRDAVLALAPRLTQGVAPWRDPDAVHAAALEWVRGSIDAPSADGDQLLLVAERDERIVGFVDAAERRHWSGALDVYVGELVVERTAEGRGVGRGLVDAVRDWAGRRGIAVITLETGAANEPARAFYAALGFAEESVRLTLRL